jgi:hypothetical protein
LELCVEKGDVNVIGCLSLEAPNNFWLCLFICNDRTIDGFGDGSINENWGL